jgi:hypothetical protein
LDGVHRYLACKELGIPIKSIPRQFNDPFEEKLFQIEIPENRSRSFSGREILRENAKKRMSLGGTMVGLANGNRKESNSNQDERVAPAEATT